MKFFAYLLKNIKKLEFVEIEKEPDEGEVLVKVKAALTCGTDLKMYKRGHPQFPFPSLFGHEASGVIAKRGKGYSLLKEGDEVLFPVSSPCLECKFCKSGLEAQCINLFDEKVWGAFAEYILIPKRIARNSLFLKPKNISFEKAALLDPLASVVYSHSFLKDLASKVLVIGAGPMGFLHSIYSKKRGYDVTVIDINEGRIEIFKNLGFKAFKPLSGFEKDLNKFDFIIECSGTKEGFEIALKLIEKGGKICLFAGMPRDYKLYFDGSFLHYNQLTIYGSFHYDRKAVLEAYNLIFENEMDLNSIFSGEYELKDLPVAIEKSLRGEGLKYVIKPE